MKNGLWMLGIKTLEKMWWTPLEVKIAGNNNNN
jgi:hypothetical protein